MSFLLSVVAGQGGVKVPGAPGTLSLAAGSPAFTVISLSWSAPSDTGGGTISGYQIKRDGSVIVADTGSTGTTYSATGLSANTSYTFNVAAINEKGAGADGNTPSLSTAANMVASGGTISTAGGYRQHVFTATSAFVVSANTGSITYDVIAVGGGGGSGSGAEWCLGGAGGGAVVTTTGEAGVVESRTVTIGAGGGGVSDGGDTTMNFGGYTPRTAGGGDYSHQYNSSYAKNGGGAGGKGDGIAGYNSGHDSNAVDGHTGGNGGRGHKTGDQYRAGGGGGGGGGTAGSDASSSGTTSYGGDGGAGPSTWYTATLGGGGGGAAWFDTPGHTTVDGGDGGAGGGGKGGKCLYPCDSSSADAGIDGTVNTGGGGGGNLGVPGNNAGGSGILIIRYAYA